jgi:hypothetical protein
VARTFAVVIVGLALFGVVSVAPNGSVLGLRPPAADAAPAAPIWSANASRTTREEWTTGNAYDVLLGAGTLMNDPRWAATTRIVQTTVTGSLGRAYRLTVKAADRDKYTSTAQRTEIGQGQASLWYAMPDGIDRKMYAGQNRWIAIRMLIPASYTSGTWNSITQFKGQGSGNGPFGLYFENGKLRLSKSQTQKYGSVLGSNVWVAPTVTARDKWLELLVHVKWSIGSDGFYELFGDLKDGRGFRQLKPLTYGWTLKLGSDGKPVVVGLRAGVYRQAVARDASIFFDSVVVAASRDSATYSAFGAVR